ncbi:MAG: AAA family ATPase, partial [Bacilli bacterium]|nr:AAA family ATPase [Bacilli bacterium]
LCIRDSILLMGMPGTGKSTISNNIAKNFESKKISITSDLLPSDILNSIINKKDILQVLQLEELNRASGKVLSVLIELLADNKITCESGEVGFSDFYVIATQNDSEISGIFDVPVAVYDRFDVSINMADLTFEELEKVLFEYKAVVEKAYFDLKHIVDITSQEVAEFAYSKEDRKVFMEATRVIDTKTYSNKRLFASSNIRGHQFAMKMAALHALVDGRRMLMPDDIADYVNNIYRHRINQFLLKMHDEQASIVMEEIRKSVLDIERPQVVRLK